MNDQNEDFENYMRQFRLRPAGKRVLFPLATNRLRRWWIYSITAAITASAVIGMIETRRAIPTIEKTQPAAAPVAANPPVSPPVAAPSPPQQQVPASGPPNLIPNTPLLRQELDKAARVDCDEFKEKGAEPVVACMVGWYKGYKYQDTHKDPTSNRK
jgi:hypothetical protein